MFRQFGIQLVFAFAAFLGPAIAAAQNVPLTRAKVGDWVEFKATASLLPGSPPQTLTMRYTVKAKADSTATITVKNSAGDVVASEHDLEWPLDKPFDGSRLAAGPANDRVKVTLDKTIPDAKHTIKGKEFQGTAYQYKVAIDLAGALGGLEVPGGDKVKPLEATVTYLVTPDAPVLGIAAFSMKGGLGNVNYELADGTGVAEVLNPLGANAKGKAKAKAKTK
jgi:hypothetical protein